MPIPVPPGVPHVPSTHDLLRKQSTGQVKAERKGGGRERERGREEKAGRPRTGGERGKEGVVPVVRGARRKAWEERAGSPAHQVCVHTQLGRGVCGGRSLFLLSPTAASDCEAIPENSDSRTS